MSWFLWIFSAFGEDIVVHSKITTVTVYSDRARVTRAVTVDVPVGRSEIVLEELPPSLLTSSLSAEGEGNATLTGIDLRSVHGFEERDVRIAALQKELQSWDAQIVVQQDIIARVQSDLKFLTELKPKTQESSQPIQFLAEDIASQLGSLARQLSVDTTSLYRELRAAESRLADAGQEKSRLERELAQIQEASHTDSQRAVVGLDAKRAGKVTLRLSYVVLGASWSPHYDARYRLNSQDVQLEMSGEVQQSTGEDWEDVSLILSTARPQQGTAPPRLDPFWLQESYGYEDSYVADDERTKTKNDTTLVVADRVTAFELTASRPEDVRSDGSRRRVALTKMTLESQVIYEVVPRRIEAAWLTAKVGNTSAFVWLPGSVSAYLGTSYVGEGAMVLTAPGESVSLSFGIDDRVRVERKRLEQKETAAKAFGNRERKDISWKTLVTNRTGKPMVVRVHDQIPATRDAAFQVQPQLEPKLEVPATGVFHWETSLADGAASTFITAYEVSWPEGEQPNLLE